MRASVDSDGNASTMPDSVYGTNVGGTSVGTGACAAGFAASTPTERAITPARMPNATSASIKRRVWAIISLTPVNSIHFDVIEDGLRHEVANRFALPQPFDNLG